MREPPITPAQTGYVLDIARKLHLPKRMIDDHCVKRFGRPLAQLSKRDGSALLDEMIPWQEMPAQMQRAMGQQDLPGLAP